METRGKSLSDQFAMNCAEIQELLTDYMTRELGDSRSALVREHLRKCERCQAAARDIAAALDLLRGADRVPKAVPTRLSDRHRRRIYRAITHPVIHWIDMNHIVVSIVVVIVLAAIALCFLQKVRIFNLEPIEPGMPINVVKPEPPLDNVSPVQKPSPEPPMPDVPVLKDIEPPLTNQPPAEVNVHTGSFQRPAAVKISVEEK